jgi:hypothetical protein
LVEDEKKIGYVPGRRPDYCRMRNRPDPKFWILPIICRPD